jgi:hypothetical protein
MAARLDHVQDPGVSLAGAAPDTDDSPPGEKRMRKRILSAGLAVTGAWCAVLHAQPTQFEARLSTVPIDASMQQDVTGQGSVTAELRGGELVVSGSFEGLQGPATAARLHDGPVTGVRGQPIAELGVDAGAGAIQGTVRLTPAQIEALRAGRLYVQLHSERAPDGNLWGWLLP